MSNSQLDWGPEAQKEKMNVIATSRDGEITQLFDRLGEEINYLEDRWQVLYENLSPVLADIDFPSPEPDEGENIRTQMGARLYGYVEFIHQLSRKIELAKERLEL